MDNLYKGEGLAYKGQVKVTTMLGKKVVKTQEFHNTGTPNLFNFFANCLWSQSTTTSSAYRPCKIVLFKQHTDSSDSSKNETPVDASLKKYKYSSIYWTEDDAVSIPMFYDKTPTGTTSLGPTDVTETWKDIQGVTHQQIVGKAITLHFRIPYIYLQGNAKIAKMGLFPSTVSFPRGGNVIADPTTEFGNMLAYYLLVDDTDNSQEQGEVQFSPIEVPESGDNFTLIVDWTLSIINA